MNPHRKIMIIVDVQNDFLYGSLIVPEGYEVIEPIMKLAPSMDAIFATRDWHPMDHMSFDINGGQWPVHCVIGSRGAEVNKRVDALATTIVSKGMDPNKEAYSGFDSPSLRWIMSNFGIRDRIYIVGLATDYCVKETALHAGHYGDVFIPLDCVRGVSPDTTADALKELESRGVVLL